VKSSEFGVEEAPDAGMFTVRGFYLISSAEVRPECSSYPGRSGQFIYGCSARLVPERWKRRTLGSNEFPGRTSLIQGRFLTYSMHYRLSVIVTAADMSARLLQTDAFTVV